MPNKSKSRKYAGMKKRRTHRMRGGVLNLSRFSRSVCDKARAQTIICNILSMMETPFGQAVVGTCLELGKFNALVLRDLTNKGVLTLGDSNYTNSLELVPYTGKGGAKLVTGVRTRILDELKRESGLNQLEIAKAIAILEAANATEPTSEDETDEQVEYWKAAILSKLSVNRALTSVKSAEELEANQARLQTFSDFQERQLEGARQQARFFSEANRKNLGAATSSIVAGALIAFGFSSQMEDSEMKEMTLGGCIGTFAMMTFYNLSEFYRSVRRTQSNLQKLEQNAQFSVLVMAAGGRPEDIQMVMEQFNEREMAEINQFASRVSALGAALNKTAQPFCKVAETAINAGKELGIKGEDMLKVLGITAIKTTGETTEKVVTSLATNSKDAIVSVATNMKDLGSNVAKHAADATKLVAVQGAKVTITGLQQGGKVTEKVIGAFQTMALAGVNAGVKVLTDQGVQRLAGELGSAFASRADKVAGVLASAAEEGYTGARAREEAVKNAAAQKNIAAARIDVMKQLAEYRKQYETAPKGAPTLSKPENKPGNKPGISQGISQGTSQEILEAQVCKDS